MIDLNKKGWQWITLLFLSFIWGSSFILMKRGLESFGNTEVAAFRLFSAFLVLLPFVYKHFKKLNSRHFFPLLVVGILGNGLPAFLFTKAQTVLASGFTGMLNSLVPIFTLLLGVLFFGLKASKSNILGVIIGFAGVCGLILISGLSLEGNFGFSFYVIFATLCYGLCVNVIKKHLQDLNAVIITSLAFVFIGPPAAGYLFYSGFFSKAVESTTHLINLGYISILGIIGTALAVLVFNFLIKKTSALFAASVTYIIPIVAMLWGFFDHEIIGPQHLLYSTVILLGVYLVNRK